MNILQAHKYYWPRDGASKYALDLSSLLENAGNRVIPFAMKHPKNVHSDYARFFVSRMDLNNPKEVDLKQKFKYASKMIYSFEAKKKMELLLQQEKIDIAHIHNIYHHITPSILPVLKKHGIKIVMTLHDYKLLSPNYTMFHHGSVHEDDARGWYTSCVVHKCHKDSYAQSAVVTAEMIFQHKFKKYYERYVDQFIAPSEFILKKHIEFGWPKEKFVHIPHPVEKCDEVYENKDEGYVAYIGRLSPEKGVETLLGAASLVRDIKFKIIGEGPTLSALEQMKREQRLGTVSFEGFKTGEKLQYLIANARIIIVPSLWYENYPLSILEAKAMGKIVIGSAIGGIPELLSQDLLFRPGDSSGLAKKIRELFDMPFAQRIKRGEELRTQTISVNNPQTHIQKIIDLYASV